MKDLKQSIQELYPTLSKQHRLLAEDILHNAPDLVFLSAKQLGERLGISSSTVVRFACKLGYDGFPEMLKALQHLFREENAPMRKLKESFREKLAVSEIFSRVGVMDRENIERAFHESNEKNLNDILRVLESASKVFFWGGRSSFALVHYAGFLLKQLDTKFDYCNSSSDIAYEKLEDMEPGRDVLFFISFHRYYKNTIDLASYARERGLGVLSLTDSVQSPLLPLSDAALFAPNTAPYYSYTAAMSLLNALVAAYAVQLNTSSKEVFVKRSELLLEKGIYH